MAKTPTNIPAEAIKPPAPGTPPVPHTIYMEPLSYTPLQPVLPTLEERKRLFELFVTMYPMDKALDIKAINHRVNQIISEYEKWK